MKTELSIKNRTTYEMYVQFSSLITCQSMHQTIYIICIVLLNNAITMKLDFSMLLIRLNGPLGIFSVTLYSPFEKSGQD